MNLQVKKQLICDRCAKIIRKRVKLKINVIINGETREFESEVTLAQVLKELSLEGKVMAAAVNMDIVKQNEWDSYRLKDNDKLELLDFVGGG